MRRPVVAAAVAAVLALLTAFALLLGGLDLPSTGELRDLAAKQPVRDQYCEQLRAQAGPQRELLLGEVQLRLANKPAGRRLDLRFADLTGAKLDGMNFSGADLQFARLGEASLEGADFSDADLTCATLTLARGQASFRAANLTAASLIRADLQKSAFTAALLGHADLTNAVLKEAELGSADLSFARLFRTDLDKANLARAGLALADYRPVSAPRAIGLLDLDKVFPRAAEFAGLSMLRKSLIDLGENTQARTVTYMIETWRDDHELAAARTQGWLQWLATGVRTSLRRLAFELTVAYGASPRRAVLAFIWLIAVFASIYWALVETRFNTGHRGLFRVLPKGSLVAGTGGRTVEAPDALIEQVRPAPSDALPAALWFSVLSATRFGYGAFTLSSWLGALHPRQDEYRAVGVFRVLSGVQGLLSLYLLVLFVVTLFGDPFSLWP